MDKDRILWVALMGTGLALAPAIYARFTGPQTDRNQVEVEEPKAPPSDPGVAALDCDQADSAKKPTEEQTRLWSLTTHLISDQLGVEAERISSTSRLKEDLGLDSLDCVELVMAVEEEFQLEILDEEAETWSTAGDVFCHIQTFAAPPPSSEDTDTDHPPEAQGDGA